MPMPFQCTSLLVILQPVQYRELTLSNVSFRSNIFENEKSSLVASPSLPNGGRESKEKVYATTRICPGNP